MTIAITAVFSVLSSILYRLGGMSVEEKNQKLPFFPDWTTEKITRRMGCSLLSTFLSWIYMPGAPFLAYIVSFGATFGMLSTYWDFINGEDNFYLHGIGIGLAGMIVPIWAVATGSAGIMPVFIMAGRATILSLAMGVWCAVFSNVDVEEYFRGMIIAASYAVFLIG